MTKLDELLDACATEVERRVELATHEQDVLRSGAVAFRQALVKAEPRDAEPTTVPVARCIADLDPSPLVELVRGAADEIHWTTSIRLTDGGTEAALAVLNDVRTFGEVTVGLLLLDRGREYPEHSHPPQEIYLPIAGEGRWRYGGNTEHCALVADALVYNHPNDRHGIKAGAKPLLALYVLWP